MLGEKLSCLVLSFTPVNERPTVIHIQVLINEDGVEVPLPDLDETRWTIEQLKNKKVVGADGLLAELFKGDGKGQTIVERTPAS